MPENEPRTRQTAERGLGVIVAQIYHHEFLQSFDWSRFVSVACAEGTARPPCHLVMPHHFGAVQEAWDRAWAAGYRRIGLAIFAPQAIDSQERCAAFFERQSHTGEDQRIPVFELPDLLDRQGGYDQAVSLIGGWARQWNPDLVLGFNDLFYWILRDAVKATAAKVEFYCLWITRTPSACSGLLLTTEEVGRRCIDFMDSLMRSGERGIPSRLTTLSIGFTWHDATAIPADNGRRPRSKRRAR